MRTTCGAVVGQQRSSQAAVGAAGQSGRGSKMAPELKKQIVRCRSQATIWTLRTRRSCYTPRSCQTRTNRGRPASTWRCPSARRWRCSPRCHQTRTSPGHSPHQGGGLGEKNSRPNMRILRTMIWWISGAMTEPRGSADFPGGGGSRATNVRAKMFPCGGLFPKQGPLGRPRHEQPAENPTSASAMSQAC